MADLVTLQVRRYRPEEEEAPTWQSYEVPLRREWMVLDALNYVKDELDGRLSFRWSCRMGVCGSCGMMVNDEPVLTCATFLSKFAGKTVRVEPLKAFPVVRDLVVEIQDFIAKLKRSSRGSSAARRSRSPTASTCRPRPSWRSTSPTACASTVCSATPLAPSSPWNPTSSARPSSPWPSATTSTPATRGREERMDVLSQHEGIWGCTFVGECSVVCPKHVDPAGAIQRYKLDAARDWLKSVVWPWGSREGRA